MRRLTMSCVLLAIFAGCGDGNGTREPLPTATPLPVTTPLAALTFRGTYDVRLRGELEDLRDVVGRVDADPGDDISLGFAASGGVSMGFGGTLAPDGSLTLAGVVRQPRRSFALVAHGVASSDGQVRRIVIDARSESSFLDFATTVVFETPITASPFPFDGTHRFEFTPSPSGCDCSSTATLSITTLVTGYGMSDLVAEERDATGTIVGAFQPGECDLTATGRVFCRLLYERRPIDPSVPPEERPLSYALLFGRLARDRDPTPTSGRLEGDRARGDPPAPGTWTATRAATSP